MMSSIFSNSRRSIFCIFVLNVAEFFTASRDEGNLLMYFETRQKKELWTTFCCVHPNLGKCILKFILRPFVGRKIQKLEGFKLTSPRIILKPIIRSA
ncbi:hypothetical protein Y032_0089g2267 [Ancylostoma ceylanicum]|uniref:Uncharacterized protein n=1 Tax=Ancylostoma ceylanicum TaxID=53326 RepID=A0A016TNE1_9BILA|nr:hypothetical protein Y032_0089g2267 [Ancylostoma ceylanicum]